MSNKTIIKRIIRECFGFKNNEQILIVHDDGLKKLAEEFYQATRTLKAECLLMRMAPRQLHGQEPPRAIASAMKHADIAILLTSMSLSHTRARKEACVKYGTRIASLPGITYKIFKRSININYSNLKRKTRILADKLTKGSTLHVTTKKGTDLRMDIKGRKGYADDGALTKSGAFGNLPAGEACVGPKEGTANGKIVVDASAPLVGKMKKPITIHVKNGLIETMPLTKIASMIKPLGKCARTIAEIGIGLNPKAKITGVTLEDEKAVHTAHVAIGANISFGGRVSCPCHLDFVFTQPRIFIDGKRITI